MDFRSIRSDSSDDDRDDSSRFSAEDAREKRDTNEILGKDYLEFVKDESVDVKDDRFSRNLESSKSARGTLS